MSGPRRGAPDAGTVVPGRRGVLTALGGGLVLASLAACGNKEVAADNTAQALPSVPERDDTEVLTWKQARKRLEEGNLRFVEGRVAHPDQSAERRTATGTGAQRPFATVLACADSRVPPELVFDQGLGDLFVVRSAGQVVDHAVLGTLQFGVAEFDTPLLLVLGHTGCGAVKATLEAVDKKSPATGTDVDTLVDAITPAVRDAEGMGAKPADVLGVAVDNNVERVVEELAAAKVLGIAAKSRKLRVLGAVYDLATGEATFL